MTAAAPNRAGDRRQPGGDRNASISPGVEPRRAQQSGLGRRTNLRATAPAGWEYEPTTFPILWNLDGEVIESFAPDFYLPDLEVFLEMTTLRQRLVRKKNRKLRRLRELYPDIRIKLFYARDFRAMMLKYGRLGLAESLSGTPGQMVPDRGPSAASRAGLEPTVAVAAEAPVRVAVVEPLQPPAERSAGSPGARSTSRSRQGRRRRGSGAVTEAVTEAGAEREAGA